MMIFRQEIIIAQHQAPSVPSGETQANGRVMNKLLERGAGQKHGQCKKTLASDLAADFVKELFGKKKKNGEQMRTRCVGMAGSSGDGGNGKQVTRWMCKRESSQETSGGRVEYDRRPMNKAKTEILTHYWHFGHWSPSRSDLL